MHVDPKASPEVHEAVSGLVGCYQRRFPSTRLFLARDPVPVFWARGSVLEADMVCLRQLLERRREGPGSEWKLFLNAASSELPLVGHQEFRRRLSEAGGKSIVHFGKPEKGRQDSCFDEVRCLTQVTIR